MLITARLHLRPYRPSDFDDFATLNADEEVRRHVGGPLAREKAATLFEKFISAECLPGNEVWAVVLKDSDNYIGHCWFVQQGTENPEMGLLVAKNYWRQGYGTEIAQAMFEYAKKAGFRRISATVDCDHIASIRLLECVGLKRERIEQDDEGTHYVYSIESC